MKLKDRIITCVALDIMLVIAYDCLFGFLYGGRIGFYGSTFVNMYFFAFLVAVSLVISYTNIIFCKRKNSSKRHSEIIAVAAALVLCSAVLYSPLNTLSAKNDAVTYDSNLTYVHQTKSILPFSEVEFENDDGDSVRTVAYIPDISLDDDLPGEGSPVKVTQRTGGFGYPVYDLEYIC